MVGFYLTGQSPRRFWSYSARHHQPRPGLFESEQESENKNKDVAEENGQQKTFISRQREPGWRAG